ncbi:TonB-dependent receptor [Mucilaginibacter polytrichastri]|uniref:Uncharacterized protein n=1 Tax=Mucilaginibacter polytrichastri TaxID=1302689 RepID=A0A1Q5ZTK6_9SPHI|nr:TonB-dependent receptor [Mucilaginibacter polytrichastri]OKS85063.1 hypothetical protein RG47T_0502 [Mucilaginibacter polytrichastri]SFS45106.1 TonB dependent receptor [Mucilaginibacter polytrichastri]
MKSRYIFSLLVLGSVACFSTTNAQTTPSKPKAKTAAKPAAKKPVVTPAAKPKATNAKKLGDVAAKSAAQDTSKKGGNNPATDPNKNNSLSEEIIVTTAYKPVLADAVKIRRNPSLEDKTPYKAPLTYNSIDKRLEQNTAIKQLEAAKLAAERDSIQYNNYVKLGVGNLKTTFGEAYINNGKDEALQFGAWAKHFGQQGSDAYKQNQSREELGVFGKSIGDVNTLSGRITYNYGSNYFYGYAPQTPPVTADPAHQHFSTIGAEGELVKNFKDTDRVLDYALKAKGYIFSNAFKARENNIVLTGFLNQTIKQFYAGLGGTLDMSSQKDNAYSINNSLLRLNPYLKFQGDNYKIDAGVNIITEFGYSSRVSVLPAAKAELQVIPDYLRLYVEAKGDVNKASLKSFSDENPFIGQNINIKNSVDQLDLTAGVKGTLAPGLGFKAEVFRYQIKDMALFVSNFLPVTGNNQFQVIYDNGKSKVSGFRGELDYKASDDFDIFGKAEFKDYKMNSQLEAWNMPKFNISAGTVVHVTDKLNITGTLVVRGQTKDLPYTSSSVLSLADQEKTTPYTISSFADVSAGANYKINRKISVFVQANNLLNSNNKTWLYYRNYGFNIFGGVGFGF